ncbi:MAG: M23 family metallopeptidase [Bacilli bacterium]
MTNRKLKKPVVYCLYGSAFLLLFAGIFFIEKGIGLKAFRGNEDFNYVSRTVFDDSIPVVNTNGTITRPYTAPNVKIIKNFYDYKADEQQQQSSIIIHDKTYLQNSGISYGLEEMFDVMAVMGGTVTKVTKDNLLGNIIEIKHDNEIISIYQSLSSVNVKQNDIVNQGQIIGKSGNSNISTDLGNHLYFELVIKGTIVNPENYYDKKINEL